MVKKIFKIILIILSAIIILFVFLSIFTPLKYGIRYLLGSTQERIEISLPFTTENEAIGLSPAGELLYHDGDLGHCGIDFGFNKSVNIIASADGEVQSIKKAKEEQWDVTVISGDYVIGYYLLKDYNQSLHKGVKVVKGGLIGHTTLKTPKEDYAKRNDSAFHYEFKSSVALAFPWFERLCPYTYFDNSSKERLDRIWANDEWSYKEIYPYVCSGGYEGRDSLEEARALDKSGYRKNFNMTRDRQLAEEIDKRNQGYKEVEMK
ncbi:MAG: hypothetical protein ACP5NZ_04480 [Nanobdellota archaeon]